jgi:predicted nuclease of predicted toxin-antitoxin system
LKLLLDEMYTYSIAEQLRGRGHDVVAVAERPGLRGAPDREVFETAQDEGRALVTDDIGFREIASARRASGETHHGLVFTSNKRFPRGHPRIVGQLVRALDRFLSGETTALGESPSFTYWLR